SVSVENGAILVAGRDADLRSTVSNTLSVTAIVPVSGDIANLSVAYGKSRSDAKVTVVPGATIQAASLSLLAQATNNFSTVATADDGGIGGAVALTDYSSEARVDLAGNVVVSGDVDVTARSVNTQDQALATSVA